MFPIVRKTASTNGFFLIKPKENSDADKLATRIVGVSGIDKVHVTEGDYGFIAVARFSSDKGRETIRQLLSKAVGRDLGELTSRYIYKKNRGVL